MTPRRIADLCVHPIGLGAMPLSDRAMLAERPRALATVHAALDSGSALVDTADIYAPDGAFRAQRGARRRGGALLGGLGQGTDRGGDQGRDRRTPDRTATVGSCGVPAGPGGCRPSLGSAAGRGVHRPLHRLDPGSVRRAGGWPGGREGRRDRAALAVERHPGDAGPGPWRPVAGPDEGGIVAVQNEFSARYRADADVWPVAASAASRSCRGRRWVGPPQAGELGSRYGAIAAERGTSAQQVALVVPW